MCRAYRGTHGRRWGATPSRPGDVSVGRIALRIVLSVLVVLALAMVVLAGHDHSTVASTDTPTSHAVLALGDSVPSGHACDCSPFPEVYGTLLGRRTGVPVSVDNRAVSGLDTAGLIDQLGRPAVQGAVRRSDIVLIMIGANDFGDHHDEVVSGECDNDENADCVSDEIGALHDHLTSILSTIATLRRGRPTTVLVTGYWNVFQDGDVARKAVGEDGLTASLALTRRANAVINSVSSSVGADYVNIFSAFQNSGKDITTLMAPDGDHPDAAGHRLIADALLAEGLPLLT